MNISDFDYDLPPERIAQRPPDRRDEARLMVLDRRPGQVHHSRIDRLADWLRPGDLVVVNDTAVFPARLRGARPSGGRVELTLLEPVEASGARPSWRCLVKASRGLRAGERIELCGGIQARVLGRDGPVTIVELAAGEGGLDAHIDAAGTMPLPPYIRRPDPDSREGRELAALDRERYQTMFARRRGAVAAPTAGLHFTPRLVRSLATAGIETAALTLHVGAGTFLPVRSERVEDHTMHAERFELPQATASAIRRARGRGGRVVAVGTTVVRTLEHCAEAGGAVKPGSGRSALFIYPGFPYRVVDVMITNFHLPRSTLLMLVCAFAGRERLLAAYREAVEARYRFYSYGDAMLVTPGR